MKQHVTVTAVPGHTRIDLVARPNLQIAARCSDCGWVGPTRKRLLSARDDAAGHLLEAVS